MGVAGAAGHIAGENPGVDRLAVGVFAVRRNNGGTMTGYIEYRRGVFRVSGPGRCDWCGFHVPTQKHRDGCPQDGKDT